ncbi:hypothetical protein AUJ65_00870 [Candidatus Micrarchaeota archaeon CG1_02_51_15]|nr:MAG: hypothetical protein AUJ65_00870 [Candidatus Micrarchaeota archaeon CG1_02_51_15]
MEVFSALADYGKERDPEKAAVIINALLAGNGIVAKHPGICTKLICATEPRSRFETQELPHLLAALDSLSKHPAVGPENFERAAEMAIKQAKEGHSVSPFLRTVVGVATNSGRNLVPNGTYRRNPLEQQQQTVSNFLSRRERQSKTSKN